MSSLVLLELEELIEHVIKHLPMKCLNTCSCVCKNWNTVVQRIKRSRKQLDLLLHNKETSDGIHQDVEGHLKVTAIEPMYALVFCSTTLQEGKLAIPSRLGEGRLPRAAKLEKMCVTDYIQSVLPSGCELLGTVTDGVIGCCSPRAIPRELENSEGLSCLLLPELEGVKIKQFFTTPKMLEKIGPFSMTTYTTPLNPHILAEATGIPESEKPKLILMFQTEAGVMFNKDTDLNYALLRQYENIVIAGAYVDSLIPEENDTNLDDERGEPNGLGIAFIGDNIKVASVLVGRHAKTKADVEKTLQKLKKCHIPENENTVGFMFACIGRGEYYYREKNVESSVFHRLFPGVPLVGLFGNGETGYDYLPDYSKPEGDSTMSLIGRYPDDESGYVWDMPQAEHSYTTVFVLMSLGK